MKKKVLAVLTIVLCLSILGGVTSAYYTDRDTAHNVITTGNVKIRIVEQQKTEEGLKPYPAGPIQGVMPGADVSKIVRVSNTGTGDAWVRVRVESKFELSDKAPEKLPQGQDPADMVTLKIDNVHWEQIGDWYYYRQPLTHGKTTEPLIETVSFSAKMGNAFQGASAYVDVSAEAVQSRNNDLPASGKLSDIPGWPTAK